jgi:hypothetical protein
MEIEKMKMLEDRHGGRESFWDNVEKAFEEKAKRLGCSKYGLHFTIGEIEEYINKDKGDNN